MSFEQILIDTENYIYNQFESMCYTENITGLELFIKKFNIDVNGDDGYYLELISKRNDLELLQMFIRNGANVHLNNDELLSSCAHRGLLHIVQYLL